MAISSGKTAVGTTAVVVYNATNVATVKIVNDGSIPVFVGPVGVTKDNGFPIVPGKVENSPTFDVSASTAIYAVAETADGSVRFYAKE